ncbi:MAG: Xaa-Pro peptidase family protein [bacterium]|nr:Xaa-Pro peptidase family protein [bacterium]
MKSAITARLLFGGTDPMPGLPFSVADLYWKTRFRVGDPVFFCELPDGDAVLFVNALEYGRAKKEASGCRIELLEPLLKKAETDSASVAIAAYLKRLGITTIEAHHAMPFGIIRRIEKSGLAVTEAKGDWYPQRMVKTAQELSAIKKAQEATGRAMREAMALIRKARVASGGILLNEKGEIITSEYVQNCMRMRLLQENCFGASIIVACGDQAADPHKIGSGPLQAHLPIVIDVFPRSLETLYWADMTRTVFKGEPTKECAAMYRAVLEAQKIAEDMTKAGVDGNDIQQAVERHFIGSGYKTGKKDKIMQGFIHSVGHGVGLDIHEKPGIGKAHMPLPEGSVVTIEPGLYYLGIGGVRIEDMVVVQKDGAHNLTGFPKELGEMIL